MADLKVSTDASENTSHKANPYRAFRIAHAGKQGAPDHPTISRNLPPLAREMTRDDAR